MKALLVPLGSAGDVHPFVGLGKILRARGHEATVITNEHFGPLVRREGLDFVPLGTEEEFLAVLDDPDLWHSTRGFRTVLSRIDAHMRPSFERIAERFVPGETVVISSMLGFGPRLAHEALGVPFVSLHLQPSVLRSIDEPPVYPGIGDLKRWPRGVRRGAFWLMDAAVIDRILGPPVNRFRAELGLAPLRRLFDRWIHSPQRVIGLFPDWLSPPQADWPPNVLLTGFPLYDESTVREPDPAVAAFLADGEPPIVVTPGSAMKQGRAFFAEAIAAIPRVGRRGLLLTRFPDQLPHHLPDGIIHQDYIPFSRVLPHAAALVHHGGIGTTAQALAAGIPQLVVPMAHDQFDNAARLVRLGVARSVPLKRFRAAPAADALRDLITSQPTAARCRELANRVLPPGEALTLAAVAIERLMAQPVGTGATVA